MKYQYDNAKWVDEKTGLEMTNCQNCDLDIEQAEIIGTIDNTTICEICSTIHAMELQ